ncbi:MAG TPA: Ig-like domain-containing protein [Myxococcota bacterium]|nr:Ig-like domain-containing protein [Myxococcota bacterium]
MNKLILLVCVLSAGCMSVEPPDTDSLPPTAVEFMPQGDATSLGASVEVLFSEPVLFGQGEGNLVILVRSDRIDGQLLADFDKPPLTAKNSERLVACDSQGDLDGRRIVLDPREQLKPATAYTVAVSAAVTDLAGNRLVTELRYDERGRPTGMNTHLLHEFTTEAGGVRITEIMANPEGPESEGEYVELANLGSAAVDLRAFRIDDSGGSDAGDLLSPCEQGDPTLLGPGSVALLVGQAFVPPSDLRAGTALFCTGHATLTPHGLRNAGDEVIVIKDAQGQERDRYGGWVDMSNHEGCALMRLDPAATDGEDNWAFPEGEACRSPGWIDTGA